ncbi:hypothetical protein Zmor_017974 [Zophobas morio]|uniref:Uncharacterized protein n=1 Tax=Zophobas morio TaxID=2755281 RepID=A0AA38IA73_9CUCU|nr:hypothetical protein Zmor_017974 [Zophobas morio]
MKTHKAFTPLERKAHCYEVKLVPNTLYPTICFNYKNYKIQELVAVARQEPNNTRRSGARLAMKREDYGLLVWVKDNALYKFQNRSLKMMDMVFCEL